LAQLHAKWNTTRGDGSGSTVDCLENRRRADKEILVEAFEACTMCFVSYGPYEKVYDKFDVSDHLPKSVEITTKGHRRGASSGCYGLLCKFKNALVGMIKKSQQFLDDLQHMHGESHDGDSMTSHPSHSKKDHDDESPTYHVKWFFGNWKEGAIWHETDVLLVESKTTAMIVFRGSNGPADLITNSQTLEDAQHSDLFGKDMKGTIHRGMLNAYYRVDNGLIIPSVDIVGMGNSSDKLAQRTLRPYSHSFGGHMDALYNNCSNAIHRNSRQKNDDAVMNRSGDSQLAHNSGNHTQRNGYKGDKAGRGVGCKAKNISLQRVLKSAGLAALQSGRRLVVSGHSLGGALSALYALDMIVNEADTIRRMEQEQLRKSENVFDMVVGSVYRITSATYEALTGAKKLAEDSLFKRIHVYTFGEPEFADELFWSSMKAKSPEAASFLEHQYHRFVSLSAAPACEPDIVTGLMKILGVGKNSTRNSREEGRSGSSSTHDNANNCAKKGEQAVGNASCCVDDVAIDDTENARTSGNMDRRPCSSTRARDRSENCTGEVLHKDGDWNQNTSSKSGNQSNDRSDSKHKHQQASSARATNGSEGTNRICGDTKETAEPDESKLGDGRKATPGRLYVHSGRAKNKVDAHFLMNYLMGIKEQAEADYGDVVNEGTGKGECPSGGCTDGTQGGRNQNKNGGDAKALVNIVESSQSDKANEKVCHTGKRDPHLDKTSNICSSRTEDNDTSHLHAPQAEKQKKTSRLPVMVINGGAIISEDGHAPLIVDVNTETIMSDLGRALRLQLRKAVKKSRKATWVKKHLKEMSARLGSEARKLFRHVHAGIDEREGRDEDGDRDRVDLAIVMAKEIARTLGIAEEVLVEDA
jgi:hypothetical protein